MPLLLSTKSIALASVVVLQGGRDALKGIWYYLNHPFTIGSVEVSVTRFVEGALILGVALLLSRTLSRLLERRISKRA